MVGEDQPEPSVQSIVNMWSVVAEPNFKVSSNTGFCLKFCVLWTRSLEAWISITEISEKQRLSPCTVLFKALVNIFIHQIYTALLSGFQYEKQH